MSSNLKPPRVAIDADLRWVLRAAFADVVSSELPSDPERALQIARVMQLSGRVAARLGVSRGGAMPPSPLALDLSADYYSNVAKEALLMQAQQRIAEVAERLQVPVIAVKFAGLRLAGFISVGTRAVADLDILLPGSMSRGFWRALLAAGFRRTHTHEYSHQLEALIDPYGAAIDLHVHLPGVVVEPGGGFATADQLVARGLVTKVSGAMLVPSAAVLAAHAIAHALVQNRSTPQTYSPMRLVSDILDLRRVEPQVARLAAIYLAPSLGPTCETLEGLCARLSDVRFDEPSFEGTSEQSLLWHCLAARLDFDYAERLRAGGLAHKFKDGSSPRDIVRYIANLVYPDGPALDSLYGPVVGSWARFRRRMLRPFDLVLRATRRSVRSRAR